MTVRTKTGDLVFLESKSPCPYRVTGKRDGFTQVENVVNGFKMFVNTKQIISIKQTENRKKEIESILDHNKRSGSVILDRDDIDELQLELDLINNRLEKLKGIK